MYINEHGNKIFVGQEAIDNFLVGLKRLRENRKLHYRTEFQGLPVSVENRKGSIRKGTDPDGKEWETKHKHPYGYIPGTTGPDGDAVDVFVGPNEDAAYAYVIHINKPDTGKYDEDKVMLGFDSEEDALRCFRQHYDEPHKFYSGMDIIPMWKFRDKVFVKKETSKKLVASRGGNPSVTTYDRGQQIVAPIAMVARFYPDVLGSLETHEQIEAFPDIESPDTIPTPLKKTRSKEVSHDSLGTDQGMKKSILGHHQDIMVHPEVREGGPGSGPREHIEKAGGKIRGTMEHPTKGQMYLFDDPGSKHRSTLTMYAKDINSPEDVRAHMDSKKKDFGESEEHGVKGMKWGVHHVRKDATPKPGSLRQKTGNSISKRDLAHDPKTVNMMGHVSKGQSALAHYNAQRQQAGSQGKPVDNKIAHAQAVNALKELGWKIAGTLAGLVGMGSAFDTIRSVVRSPSGQKMFLQTGKNGSQLTSDKKGQNPIGAKAQHGIQRRRSRTSVRESGFEKRLGSFLREARRGKIYYARSLQRYGSSREAKDIDDLREAFPEDSITFPKTRRHAELGMGHFHKKIDKAKEVVITGLHRRKITAGVASEARHALKKGIPVRFLRHGKLHTVEAIENIEGGKPGGHYARVIFAKRRKKK